MACRKKVKAVNKQLQLCLLATTVCKNGTNLSASNIAFIEMADSRGIFPAGCALAVITVSDSVLSIPVGKLPFVFDRFHRSQGNAIGQGTGLGLAIVVNIAQLLGEEVRISSEEGVGSQFALSLPLSRVADADADCPA